MLYIYSGMEKVHYCDIIFKNVILIHEILAYHFEDGCIYQSGRQYQIKNLKSEGYSISIWQKIHNVQTNLYWQKF